MVTYNVNAHTHTHTHEATDSRHGHTGLGHGQRFHEFHSLLRHAAGSHSDQKFPPRRYERERERERERKRDQGECKFSDNFNSPDYKIDPNSNSHAYVTPVANLNLPLCWRS